ncbi:MAG TPA: hypothetical protein VMZ29_05570 [Candidatus Bathyarchaeia archaeon]|nr:hypothetical protein [Candidatus Bathyarchaeia archaeon]
MILGIIITVGFTAFLSLIITAMIIYDGGNFDEPNLPKYSFYKNFISDLGRIYTFDGELNIVPRILFQVSVIFGGIAILTLYAFLIDIFRKEKRLKKIGITGASSGILSAIFCMMIAFLAFDIYNKLPVICMFIFGIFIMLANFILFFTIRKINEYPNFYKVLFIGCNFLLLVFIVINIAIEHDSPYWQEIVKIVGQKIVFAINIINLGLQVYGINKYAIAYDKSQALLAETRLE